jgi:hypothetical protein
LLLWATASSRAERALAIVLPVAFRLALAVGAFHFELPVQIVDLATRGTDPLMLFLQQDLWWARYLVAYPSIVAMDHWGMRFVDAFALYSAALLAVTAMVLLASVRTWRRLTEPEAFVVGLALAALVGAIATQMNGRLIPAHIGMGAIVLAQARIFAQRALRLREGVLLGSGLVLSQMTSGTGLVAYADLLAWSAVAVVMRIDRAQVLAIVWVLSAFFAPLLLRDLLKNVDFYGGGVTAIIAMLDHGAGIVLRRQPSIAFIALAAAVLGIAVAWRSRGRLLRLSRALWPPVLAIPVTAVGGLYGYSTLSMALPSLLILLVCAAIGWSSRPRSV